MIDFVENRIQIPQCFLSPQWYLQRCGANLGSFPDRLKVGLPLGVAEGLRVNYISAVIFDFYFYKQRGDVGFSTRWW